MSLTLQATDSKKKVRTLTVSGFTNDCGTKCARVLSDNGKEYFVRVKNGIGTCTCESRKPCYHISAIASITLPTVEEMEQALAANRVGTISIDEALSPVVEYAKEIDNPYEILGPTKQITSAVIGSCGHWVKPGHEHEMCGGCYQRMYM
jgi:hypothetical protein